MWPAIRVAFGWVHLAARILGTEGIGAAAARRRLGGLLGAICFFMREPRRGQTDAGATGCWGRWRVTRTKWARWRQRWGTS